jgi:hypothetical protein
VIGRRPPGWSRSPAGTWLRASTVTFKDGAVWELDGHDLEVAREKAQKVRATSRATAAAGDRMLDVVLYAYEHPEGVRRGDVAKALKLEPSVAGVYLARAADGGRLRRAERGLYTPVTSVTSLRPGTANVTDNTRNTPPEAEQLLDDPGGSPDES